MGLVQFLNDSFDVTYSLRYVISLTKDRCAKYSLYDGCKENTLFHASGKARSHKYLSSLAASKMRPQILFLSQWSAKIYQGLQLPENICENSRFVYVCIRHSVNSHFLLL